MIFEDHARALREHVGEIEAGANEMITSTLGWVEVSRSLQRRFPDLTDQPRGDLESEALSGVAGFPISHEVVAVARRIGAPGLRSLDALHCATATLSDADVLISYDRGMLSAAMAMGITVASPGAEL